MKPHLHCFVFFSVWNLMTLVNAAPVTLQQQCPNYERYAKQRHPENLSPGNYQLPYMRPPPKCRSFYSREVEEAIERLQHNIKDPDLFRLFENAWPNTLDTMVKWTGFARENGTEGEETDEDLAFVITGDM